MPIFHSSMPSLGRALWIRERGSSEFQENQTPDPRLRNPRSCLRSDGIRQRHRYVASHSRSVDVENLWVRRPRLSARRGTFHPDTRGATSIRDQLEKHRGECDLLRLPPQDRPHGFRFQSFDAIGQWRDKYNKNVAVDLQVLRWNSLFGHYRIPGSHARANTSDRSSLVSKLLELGTGRRMEIGDRPPLMISWRN